MGARENPGFLGKAAKEFKSLLAITVYFWVLFTLFAFHKALLTKDNDVLSQLGFALINAHVMAKFVLIGEHIHIRSKMKRHSLVYDVLLKSFIFAIVLFIVRLVEEGIVGVIRGRGFAQSILEHGPAIGNATWVGIFMVCIIIFVALIPFFAFRQLREAIGQRDFHQLIFGGTENHGSRFEDARCKKTQRCDAESQWYYEQAGQVFGPISQAEIVALINAKQVNKNTLVWACFRDTKWRSLEETEIWIHA